MIYPGLSAKNCIIKNNICGTIGYWVSASSKVVNISPNINAFSDKNVGMLINNNICHYISNLDHTGHYFMVSRAPTSTTGYM